MWRFVWCVASIGILSAPAAAQSAKAGHLKTEYRIDPAGIDAAAPRLQWQLTLPRDSTQRGVRQTAYQIQAFSDADLILTGKPDLWDTGKVISDQSTQIVYAGKPLASRQSVAWRVRIWDQDDKPSDWSDTGNWSMGLLNNSDWSAKWIGKDEPPNSKIPTARTGTSKKHSGSPRPTATTKKPSTSLRTSH
jgi:alpha-L-rhamnosidase